MSDVLVVADHRRGELRPVSYELLTAGRELADALGGDVHATVVGGDVERFAEALDCEGVDAVHTVAEGEESIERVEPADSVGVAVVTVVEYRGLVEVRRVNRPVGGDSNPVRGVECRDSTVENHLPAGER